MFVNLGSQNWEAKPNSLSPVLNHGFHVESSRDFLDLVSQLSNIIEYGKPLVNLCETRLWFAVSFCAGLFNDSHTILPQNNQVDTIHGLLQRFPDAVILTDSEQCVVEGAFNVSLQDYSGLVSKKTAFTARPCAVRVYTSGSTGDPKELKKSWGTLAQTAQKLISRFQCKNWHGPIISTVPSQHMYGLEMALMLPFLGGPSVLDEAPFYASDFLSVMKKQETAINVVTTPFHLQNILTTDNDLEQVENIICATSVLSKELAFQAEDRCHAVVQEIFGCSEAGSFATRKTTTDVEWTLLDGFALNMINGRAYLEGDHFDDVIALDDVIELTGDQTFRVSGRSKEMLNVAGKRSSIGEILSKLLSIPGVNDAAVFVPQKNNKHARPAALVVTILSKKDIMKSLAKVLDPVFIPRPLKIVVEIPRNLTGKVVKEALEGFL